MANEEVRGTAKSRESQEWVHRGLTQQKWGFSQFWSLKFKIKVLAGSVSSEPLSLAGRWLPSPCLFTESSFCAHAGVSVCVLICASEDTSQTGLGRPEDLINLITSLKDLSSNTVTF